MKFRPYCTFVFLLILLGAGAPATVQAASLLQPAAGTPSKAPDRVTRRQRLVSLDTAILAAEIHPEGQDFAPGRAANSAGRDGRVSIDLFDGQSVTLDRTRVEPGQDGGVIWHAKAPRDGYGIFVLLHNTLVGVIEVDGRRYMIEPAGSRLHVLREVDVAAYPQDRHIDVPRLARKAGGTSPVAPSRAVALTYFNILVAYTALAKADMISGGATVTQVVDLDIAIANQGLINSGVPARLRRVGIAAVTATYNENLGTDAVKPLMDLTSGTTANFPAIRALRTTRAADLVTLYMNRTPVPYCGIAWVNYPTPMEAYAFSSIHALCRGSLTLAHELGHNYGLYHDRYVQSAAPASQYDFGYVDTSAGGFRTIMSYSDKCRAVLGSDCQRISYYSTPLKLFNGRKVGIPKGMPGAADAARWINEKKAIIAGFR